MVRFERVEPRYQRFMSLDHRAAWVGEHPGRPGREIRIEAGTSDGRISLWAVVPDWARDILSLPPVRAQRPSVSALIFPLTFLALLVAAAVVARCNVHARRVDRRGALLVGWFVFSVTLGMNVAGAHGLLTGGEDRILSIVFLPVAFGAVLAVAYLAIEPHARRIWPSMLVSWSRLVQQPACVWRDPDVGRSLLWGLLAGGAILLLSPAEYFVRSVLDGAPAYPRGANWDALLGPGHVVSDLGLALLESVSDVLTLTFVLVLTRIVLRRSVPAIAATFLVWVLFAGSESGMLTGTLPELARLIIQSAILLAVLIRRGVLTAAVAAFVVELGWRARVSDWGAWHSRPALWALAIFALLAFCAFRAALAGRPLLEPTTVPVQPR